MLSHLTKPLQEKSVSGGAVVEEYQDMIASSCVARGKWVWRQQSFGKWIGRSGTGGESGFGVVVEQSSRSDCANARGRWI